MKILLVLLVASFASFAAADSPAPGHAVEFSKYSSALKLVSYDQASDTFKFRGTIRLVGTLFIEFDMDTPDRANGDINFQKFVPDATYAEQLPAVTSGFYPSPVRYLNLDASVEQLQALFGKDEFASLSHGSRPIVSTRVILTLHSYSATVECDSRTYIARDVSVAPVVSLDQLAGLVSPPHGC